MTGGYDGRFIAILSILFLLMAQLSTSLILQNRCFQPRATPAASRLVARSRGVATVRMDLTTPQLAAVQQELILAAVALGEGIGNTLNTKPKEMKTTLIGGGAAALLVGARVVMGFDFQTGAYLGTAFCVLLAVNYVFRLITPASTSGTEETSFIDADGELLPSPVVGRDGRTFGWPKEYAAICLLGCVFASLALTQAASYI